MLVSNHSSIITQICIPCNCIFFCRAVAHALETLGLSKGSAIAIDMPMDVYSVVVYLAIVLAGYVVVSIADSFSPNEISTRLLISKAKAIFTQVCPVHSFKEFLCTCLLFLLKRLVYKSELIWSYFYALNVFPF